MESDCLKKLRRELSELPVLEKRLAERKEALRSAETARAELKRKCEAESRDVERLEKDSFAVALLRLIGRYEGKLTKEAREELAAKQALDQAVEEEKRLRADADDLAARVKTLRENRGRLEEELARRREEIKRLPEQAEGERFRSLEKGIEAATRGLAENAETVRTVNEILQETDRAMECLDRAGKWATFDFWTRGGLLSYEEKYTNIDEAEAAMNIIRGRLKELESQLADIGRPEGFIFASVSPATRAVDYWFDNVFTDSNVRSLIKENRGSAAEFRSRLETLLETLAARNRDTSAALARMEREEEDLLVNLE